MKNSLLAFGFALFITVEASAVTGDDLPPNGDTECWFKPEPSSIATETDTGVTAQVEGDEDSQSGSTAYPAPGTGFRDRLRSGGKRPEMVVVPSGRFRMVCVSGIECSDNEKPVHDVEIAPPFALSIYEITFEDYDRFTYPLRMDPHDRGNSRHPVFNVMWDCANDYAAWLSEQTSKRFRLPTEAEWEYAARADSTTAYFWGNDIGRNLANCGFDFCGDRWEATASVGSFPANAWGLHDMHGNVYEWVQDCWNDSYVGAPKDGSAWLSGDCDRRVVRGGSFHFFPTGVRSAFRDEDPLSFRYNFQGFRLARDL